MKLSGQIIFTFICILASGKLLANSYSQLPSLMRFEDGLSMKSDGTLVSDDRYTLKSDGDVSRIVLKKAPNKTSLAVKKNVEGRVDYLVYESTAKISIVNLRENGYLSSTLCSKNVNPGAGVNTTNHNVAGCVTLNKQICDLILKESGAKSWNEFIRAHDICQKAGSIKVGVSDVVRDLLAIEKTNVDNMKILADDIKFSEYKPSSSDVQLRPDADLLRRMDYLSEATNFCPRALFVKNGKNPGFKYETISTTGVR